MSPILHSCRRRGNGLSHSALAFPALLLSLSLAACGNEAGDFVESWDHSADRPWVGPHLWANRLQDWRVHDGRLESVASLPMRTVHLLTRRVGPEPGSLRVAVNLGILGEVVDPLVASAGGSAGLLLGSGAGLDYRSAALVHHSWGQGGGLFAGIDREGRLFVRDFETEDEWLARAGDQEDRVDMRGGVNLSLTAAPADSPGIVTLNLVASTPGGSSARLRLEGVPADRLTGNVSIVSDVPDPSDASFWFDDFSASGGRLMHHPERALGPVVGFLHTLSRGTLKLTAQFVPLGPDDPREATLEAWADDGWVSVGDATPIVEPGFTATFRVENWDDSTDTRVRVLLPGMAGLEGFVPRDPTDKPEIVVAAFTGNHNVAKPVPGRWSGVDGGWFPWDWGVWFPHTDIVRHVADHDPDFLFFSGDQVYEGASPTAPDREQPYLDYLYRWYLWHWAFGDLTRRLPSVSIPDDHDVYHGNVWGAGGIPTPAGLTGPAAQDAGGYRMPAEFVRMVERTQASHLPDSPDPAPVAQGIGVYFTDILYGGVSFAVLEDRKFKSAPGPLLPAARVVNGWAQNTEFDARRDADAPEAVLLGERQISFLERWASDWTDGTWMKVALSQTLFANLATLPASETSDANVPTLRVVEAGEYPTGDRQVADMDSNGWPQAGRDRALRAMRRGFAVHLAGDQHLGSTLQYGIDTWEDAGFALCVPSIANFFPRRWFPPQPGLDRPEGSPAYTGRFMDGFGNRMTVRAVSNPVRTDKDPAALHDLAPGYGIARFHRSSRRVRLEAWPRWADPSAGDAPYPGWPVEFDQLDGYGGTPAAWLPELRISGQETPVVQIISQSTGRVVYTLRIPGSTFAAPVFGPGKYIALVGEPMTKRWIDLRDLVPGPRGRTQPIEVNLPSLD